jgi:protease I
MPRSELADLAEAPLLPLARRAIDQGHLRPSDPQNRRMTNVQGSMTVPTLDNLRIAMLATDEIEEPELAELVGALREAGARTELLSIKPGQIQAVQHDLQPTQTFAVDKTLDQADPEDYDALVLRGGAVNADRLRTELACSPSSSRSMAPGSRWPSSATPHGDWSRAACPAAGP